MSSSSSVTFEDIQGACHRLDGVAHYTPVLTSTSLNHRTDARVFVKCENFQRTSSFKFRGAYNTLSQLDSSIKEIISYSSGNHAQAVALAGTLLKIRSTIIMPHDAPKIKREATIGYGADIILYDRNETSREELAHQVSNEKKLPIIPPYDHPHIIAGQGTATLELLNDHPDLDILLVPCGGGGLLSGASLVAHALNPKINVIGIEPANANDAEQSFKTGVLHSLNNSDTIADGARTPSLGKLPFKIIQKFTHDIISVPDTAIITATRFIWERMKLVVEPTGALGLAALLTKSLNVKGQNVGIILSGGNVDLNQLATFCN
ncbi:MAG: threo-3-hydroxy-L-aspartate ammonia-lyase [Bacteroidetes bacterium]|nr:threo-3-hydroxy-L-aspartate ammonia-lyase [Bacteroidota bacterium]